MTDAIEEPRTYAKLDGESIVAFSISRAKGESDTEVAAAAATKIEEIKKLSRTSR